MSPSSAFSSTGVSATTVPSFDARGQLGTSCVPKAICADEHACSPAADDGDTTIPDGTCIVASRPCAVDGASGTSDCGTLRSTSTPDGASARRVGTETCADGVNGICSHPVVTKSRPAQTLSSL